MPDLVADRPPPQCEVPCLARRGDGCGISYWQVWLGVCNRGHVDARHCPWFQALMDGWRQKNA